MKASDYRQEKVLILDFGSQYTMLIARRVRELKVYSEIFSPTLTIRQIKEFAPAAIILSGGPASVLEPESPKAPRQLFDLGIPILGICYGMQLMTHLLNGKVAHSRKREYGPAELIVDDDSDLFAGIMKKQAEQDKSAKLHHDKIKNKAGRGRGVRVWMSHGDRIEIAPEGFESIAHSENSPLAAIRHKDKKIYGVQFHPEVAHTPLGKYILANFLFKISGLRKLFTPESFIESTIQRIRSEVGKKNLVLGLSGGVDSSVAALLIHKAIKKQLTCIFVNNGLLRQGEAELVIKVFKDNFYIPLRYVDASDLFLQRLIGVDDPEEKRKIIGHTFIEVFEKEAKNVPTAQGSFEFAIVSSPRNLPAVEFLGQGTLYPDVIESTSFRGPSSKIKSHHNVGGLPEQMNLKLVEPLRELFKDEVRAVGKELGLPDEIIWRQPFPGPGLAVRIIGDVSKDRLEKLRKADAVVREEIEKAGLGKEVWQYFAVLLPVKSVGVMGDERTYENVIAVRAVKSVDGMTADWADLPSSLLGRISSRIINEVKGINRVVYDISSKPPSTIEWE